MLNLLLSYTTNAYNFIDMMTKHNPVVAGIVSLWGIAVLTFALRNVPLRILHFLKKELTTTLVLNNSDQIYYEFLDWVSQNKMHDFVRDVNFNNSGRYGVGKASFSIGYGIIWFTHKKHLLKMQRVKVEAQSTMESKESIYITLIGRNKKIFQDLFNTILEESKKDNNKYITVYRYYREYWSYLNKQYKRDIKTVSIPKDTRNELLDHIGRFLKDKEWYLSNGIPWRTGILLSGPPGTGKTSLIKAICSHFNKNIYLCDFSNMSDVSLRDALSNVPEGAVIVIEDIDATNIGNRKLNSEESEQEKENNSTKPIFLTLSGVLNAIDGVVSSEGRILIATTNRPEKLDAALVREGRFDLKVKIDYMDSESFREYMNRLYPTFNTYDFNEYEIKPKIAACVVQNLVSQNRENPKIVLDKVAVKANEYNINKKGLPPDSINDTMMF